MQQETGQKRVDSFNVTVFTAPNPSCNSYYMRKNGTPTSITGWKPERPKGATALLLNNINELN